MNDTNAGEDPFIETPVVAEVNAEVNTYNTNCPCCDKPSAKSGLSDGVKISGKSHVYDRRHFINFFY